ncbi:hypothetical protein APY94_04155 [Thermococcus celericrescens]|uniref:Uncharacterized protein n=1 Tax=Thermococcus celericrescens TaxID=227598 RepID=A0A100XYE9_9EURY|nr:hypothetical protein [Thermococcus celericrescens]KUH33931.1 hypothetical protein APY94_04155 [Thermococcus celericrescens]
MPRKRRLPDVVTLKLPTYEQPGDIFDVIFESEEARKMAEQIVEYIKKNKRMGWEEYRELFPPEKHYLYFRVMKRMEALGLIGRGAYNTYILSKKFCDRLEYLSKLWLFKIGKAEELW